MIHLAATFDWPSRVTAIATAVVAFLALLALCGAMFQISQNRRVAREARLYDYMSRQNRVDEIPYEVRMADFLSLDGSSPDERIDEWARMSRLDRSELTHSLNFWEELAGMYNRNLVEKSVVRDYFGWGVREYWKQAEWFINHLRKTQSRFMCELETMCIDIWRRELGGRGNAAILEFLRWRAERRAMTASGPPASASRAVAPQSTGPPRQPTIRHSGTTSHDEDSSDDKGAPRAATMAALGVGALITGLGLVLVARKKRPRHRPVCEPPRARTTTGRWQGSPGSRSRLPLPRW
jgi:hypothetical protein